LELCTTKKNNGGTCDTKTLFHHQKAAGPGEKEKSNSTGFGGEKQWAVRVPRAPDKRGGIERGRGGKNQSKHPAKKTGKKKLCHGGTHTDTRTNGGETTLDSRRKKTNERRGKGQKK